MPRRCSRIERPHMQTETLPAVYAPEFLKPCQGSRLAGYFVAPVTHHRDSDILTESNWDAQWTILEPLHADVPADPDEDGSPVICRERNPFTGWGEFVAIHRDNAAALRAADEIARRLERYPVLDEDDNSSREWEDYAEGWRQYGQGDFFALVAKEFELRDEVRDWLRIDCPEDVAREFFESLIPSGEFYTPEGSGVSIRGDSAIRNLTRQDGCRDTLAQFIRKARKAARSARATATPAA